MPIGKTFRLLLVLLILTFYAGSGCGSANKGQTISRNMSASKVNASQLGRNKYYFSTNYQKKLTKSFKRR
jgi:hypothetical protein